MSGRDAAQGSKGTQAKSLFEKPERFLKRVTKANETVIPANQWVPF